MISNLKHTYGCFAFAAFAAIAGTALPVEAGTSKINLKNPANPACAPTPTPKPTPKISPTPTPTPPPMTPIEGPDTQMPPQPQPKPEPPLPVPPRPRPPTHLPLVEPEPASTGSDILDQAIEGNLSSSYLPVWHDYPWRRLQNPVLWSKHVIAQLRTDGEKLWKNVPGDIGWFCPKYSAMNDEQRIAFWARFISVIAEHESSFNVFDLTFTPGPDLNVYSTGLMMLSIPSAKRPAYGCTMIKAQDDLFDWRKNLACSIRIMNYFVEKDGVIAWNTATVGHSWQGISRYWEPLRDQRIKTETGRMCLEETIDLRRSDWLSEMIAGDHPSTRDEDYRRAGEKRFEHFVRLVNEFPLCNFSINDTSDRPADGFDH